MASSIVSPRLAISSSGYQETYHFPSFWTTAENLYVSSIIMRFCRAIKRFSCGCQLKLLILCTLNQNFPRVIAFSHLRKEIDLENLKASQMISTVIVNPSSMPVLVLKTLINAVYLLAARKTWIRRRLFDWNAAKKELDIWKEDQRIDS